MTTTKYKLEIDCFSGRQNPVFEISEEDFAALHQDIQNLETTARQPLFDGLGFRGFILYDSVAKIISVQKNIIKIELNESLQYKKNNWAVLSKLIRMARKYDEKKIYETIIDYIENEYAI